VSPHQTSLCDFSNEISPGMFGLTAIGDSVIDLHSSTFARMALFVCEADLDRRSAWSIWRPPGRSLNGGSPKQLPHLKPIDTGWASPFTVNTVHGLAPAGLRNGYAAETEPAMRRDSSGIAPAFRGL
jgi:hypothetical protein